MSAIAAIGTRDRVAGLAFAGVVVLPAADDDAARAAWETLPPDVAVVILTRDAHAALQARFAANPSVLPAVLP